MIDAYSHPYLTHELVYAVSLETWVSMAWNIAVEGIVRGKSRVSSTQHGVWRIWVDSMETIASMIPHGEIIRRLHDLSAFRALPPIEFLAPMPPIEMGRPMAMLRSIAWEKMPDHLWLDCAWHICVDKVTARDTEISSTIQGVWTVRCRSKAAWDMIRQPEPILGMLRWISKMRPLPPVTRLSPVLVMTSSDGIQSEPQDLPDDDDAIPASISDPTIRRVLARLKPRKSNERLS